VEFLIENPPCKEGQPPDILLKPALRAEKRPKIRVFFSAKRSSSSQSERAGSFFRRFVMLQTSASFEVRQAASSVYQTESEAVFPAIHGLADEWA